MSVIRKASHAGSWYSDDADELSDQLTEWLREVPNHVHGIGTASMKDEPVSYPVAGARIIIAPHAGYAYSGPAAAWAYKAVDWRKCKRIFLLGPSHHVYMNECALSIHTMYSTPLGDLELDDATLDALENTKAFGKMSRKVDENEHSLEMHLPYIYKMLQWARDNASGTDGDRASYTFPPLVPILVGNIRPEKEQHYGTILAPYLADPDNVFIASSDFCHWGTRFNYTYYQSNAETSSGRSLGSREKAPTDPTIHESIATVDYLCMDAIETGSHQAFTDIISKTGNTVCGRHPIGIVMAAMEQLGYGKGKFKFVCYDRSSLCEDLRDSSVSYCSAYGVL